MSMGGTIVWTRFFKNYGRGPLLVAMYALGLFGAQAYLHCVYY